MSEQKSIAIVGTHAGEHTELAVMPFVIGTAALASDVDATIILQSMGVYLAQKGYAKHVHAADFPELEELIESFIELGGKIFVCGPCIKSRNISSDDLIEGAKVVNSPTVVATIVDADGTVSY